MTEQQADYTTKVKTIFRTIKNEDHPFVMIDRRPVENPKLSWGAKGVLSYLLSRPDNWTVRLGDLVKRSTDGTNKIRGYVRELIKAGHARRVANKDPKTHRIIEWVLEVYELPFTPKATPPISTGVAFHEVENRTLNNNDSFKENESKDIKEGAAPVSSKPSKQKASDIPALVTFKDTVHHYPKLLQRPIVIEAIEKINNRLGRATTMEDLRPFFLAWCEVSGNDWSLVWLTEWAVPGRVKQNGKNKPNINDIFKEYAQEQGLSYGD